MKATSPLWRVIFRCENVTYDVTVRAGCEDVALVRAGEYCHNSLGADFSALTHAIGTGAFSVRKTWHPEDN